MKCPFETVPYIGEYVNFRGGTLPKTNMDPKDHALEKDFSIGTVGITAVHLRFRGRTPPRIQHWKMEDE